MEITLVKEETLDEEALRDFIHQEFYTKNIDEILDYLETDKGLEYLESCVCNLVGEVGMQIDDSYPSKYFRLFRKQFING